MMIARNNPFNIRYSKSRKWLGEIGHTGNLTNFKELKYGVRAGAVLLKNYYEVYNLRSISKIIPRLCVPFEDDVIALIDFVSNYTKIPQNYEIKSDDQFIRVLEALAFYNGNEISHFKIYELLSYVNFEYPNYCLD